MSLIRERFKKFKRLNIASSIHNHRLLNHIHRHQIFSHWGKNGSEYKREERLGFEKTFSLLTEGEVENCQMKSLISRISS